MSGTHIFIHIPKTAGSTLHHILQDQYKSDSTYTIDGLDIPGSIQKFSSFTAEKKNSFKLIKGHYSTYLGSQIQNEIKYFTFFREPVDRFQSSYFYIKSSPHNKYFEVINKHVNTLDKFAEWSIENNRDNMQARSLLNCVNTFNPEEQNLDLLSNMDATIDRCKEIITNLIDYVLLTERFDEGLIILKNELSWNKTPYYLKRNITRNKPQSKLIKEDNKAVIIDSALYRFAKKLYNERVSNLKFDLNFQTLEFQRQLKRKQNYLRLKERVLQILK